MTGWEVAACALAILLGSVVKAVTGMGFPLVAIPVISLFVSVTDAVAVIALPNVVMNAALCWHTRAEARHSRDLPVLGALGAVGAVIGTWLLVQVPENLLLLALAVIVIGYVGYSSRRPGRSPSPATTRRWSPAVGLAAGVMQGAVGVCGPLVAAWIHGYRLPQNAFVFSVALLFLLAGGAQLAVLLSNGMIAGARLWIALAAIPLVLGLIPLGAGLRDRLGSARFDRAVRATLLLSSAALLVRAVR
jgi:uncharacterized membrane protein YfcA